MVEDPSDRASCRAILRVTVEIPAAGLWGDETTLNQVHRQAARETIAKLKHAMQPTDVKIVGTPVVVSVITESKND